MDETRAIEIVGQYGGPAEVSDAIMNRSDGFEELAEALAFGWRKERSFGMPSTELLAEVETIIGEPVWTRAEEHERVD